MGKTTKSIKILQGTGENKIEMNVLVTQEEIEKMKEIKSSFPTDWERKELELLQEARKQIINNAAREKHDFRQVKKNHPFHMFLIAACSVFLIYQCVIFFAYNNARNMASKINHNVSNNIDVPYSTRNASFVLWAAKNEIRKSNSILQLEGMRINSEKVGLAYIRGLSASNSYDLIPFNRLVYSIEVIEVCKALDQNKCLDKSQQLLYETMVLHSNNELLYGDRITALEKFGQNTPRILMFMIAIGCVLFVAIKREVAKE